MDTKMKPHKWAKEIKAWADGYEIEVRTPLSKYTASQVWIKFDGCAWTLTALEDNKLLDIEYRIKPQQKEPQYLYVYSSDMGEPRFFWSKIAPLKTDLTYEGKIKLENEDAI